MNAGKDLDEGRFARAVFAKQGVELSRIQPHVDVAKRERRPERLGEVAQLQKRNAGRSDMGLRTRSGASLGVHVSVTRGCDGIGLAAQNFTSARRTPDPRLALNLLRVSSLESPWRPA